MSAGDTFYNRFESHHGDPSALGQEERWLSLAVGGALAAFGLSRLQLGALTALGAGAFLFYRGSTGRCPLRGRLMEQYEASGSRYAARARYPDQNLPAGGPWERDQNSPSFVSGVPSGRYGEGDSRGVDCIDEAAMESFPASDPPSFTGATLNSSPRIE